MHATLRKRVREVLSLKESAHRLALAFAVGVFVAFSPLFGFHTIMALGFAWLFRMNPMVVFTGACITNPWTFVPIYAACLWVGVLMWPPAANLPPLDISALTLSSFLHQSAPYLIPFLIGTHAVGIVCSVGGYFLMLRLVTSYRRQREERHPDPE